MRIFLLLLLGIPMTLTAQKLGERIKENTKNQIENRLEQRSGEGVEKGMDKIEDKAKGKKEKNKKSKAETTTTEKNETTPKNNPTGTPQNSNQDKKDDKTNFAEYKGSTFIPGKKTIFFEDFQNTSIGQGTDQWYIYESDIYEDIERPSIKNIPVADGSWLKMPQKGVAFPNSFKTLPEECTIEFDMYADTEKMSEHESGLYTIFVVRDDRDQYSIHWNEKPEVGVDIHPQGERMVNFSAKAEYNAVRLNGERKLYDSTYKFIWNDSQVNRIGISRKGTAITVYLNGKQYMHLAHALPTGQSYNFLMATNMFGDGIYFTNLRIATGIENTAVLPADGSYITSAILFNVNSAQIKPESWPALNMVSKIIQSTAKKFTIVGHTDSDGEEDANLLLSQQRAESVKNALVKNFGIDATRLATLGKGESNPIENNNSASGKAANRRVEFIQQK